MTYLLRRAARAPLADRDVIERLKARGLDDITAIRRHLNDAHPPHV